MGSPLSGVLANQFIENLEADHYLRIVGPYGTWARYGDDFTTLIVIRVDSEELLAIAEYRPHSICA